MAARSVRAPAGGAGADGGHRGWVRAGGAGGVGRAGALSVWPALTIVACLLSMALLAAFWDTVLVIGIGIDVALLVIAVTRPEWADRLVG